MKKPRTIVIIMVVVLCLGGCGKDLSTDENLDYSVLKNVIANYPYDKIPSSQELEEWLDSNGWEEYNIEWIDEEDYRVNDAVNNGWMLYVKSNDGVNGMYTLRSLEVDCMQEDVETIFASCNKIMEELYGNPGYVAQYGTGYNGGGCEHQLVMSHDTGAKEGYVTINSLYPQNQQY